MKTAVGNRLMLSERQSAIHDIGDEDLAKAILGDSRRARESGMSKVQMYEMSAGRAEVFIEVIQPPVPLVIFGAGHDAVPLVRFAKELGWHVTVVDPRPGYATRQKFPLADTLVVCRPEEVHEHIEIQRSTMAVVMTHHYLQDADLLRTLLPLPLRYLGLLGSKRRTQRLLHEARKEGVLLSERNLDLVYSPIGLDIGADTPEEIALAIAAEIQAVLAGRSGGMLRIREGPLHEQNPAANAITLSGTIHGVVSCG
jgi:xanthine/CO dehydrogenase XdhC/CoxF family maturation factor